MSEASGELETLSPSKAKPQEADEREDVSGSMDVLRYSQSLLRKVHSLRSNKKLCDVTLRAGGREIHTHRAVLAACSPYFLAMFTHELLESGQEVVDIKDMSPDVLSALVDFAYLGTLPVTVENVQDLLAGSSLLQIAEVQNICCEFLRKQLDASNCLGIKNFAEANGCTQLSDVIDSFARKHFNEVVAESEFLSNSWEGIAKLISSTKLCVEREEDVYAAVMRWVRQDPGERCGHLASLLKHVRLPILSVDCLMNTVDREPLVRESVECRDLLDEAKRFHLLPSQRDICSANARFVPRSSTVGRLFAVGGKESSENITRLVETYDFHEDQWREATGMIVRRQQLGVVATASNVSCLLAAYFY